MNAFNGKTIFFGHQSVGDNIVNGLIGLQEKDPSLDFALREIKGPEDVRDPAFYHGRIGTNGAPITKNEAFVHVLRQGLGDTIDCAFFKYCYVDVVAGTDVANLFSHYKTDMQQLRRQFPSVCFIHVTVPLTVVQSGPRVLVKKIIGRRIGGYEDNIRRNEYNNLVREAYKGHEPIFDLAEVQSTRPDGSRCTFSHRGREFFSLVPEYASDGRHLSTYGGEIVARHLALLLQALLKTI